MADLSILDVGHGNCAIVCDDRGAVVIDAGLGETLLEFLEQKGIDKIDTFLVSHADSDHIAGLMTLMTQPQIEIRNVFINADTNRRTRLWEALRVVIRDARQRRIADAAGPAPAVHLGLTTESPSEFAPQFDRAPVRLEVLAPTPEIAMSGAGGHDLRDRTLTANAMSAVIRIVCNDVPEALLPGDLDNIGLENLLDEHQDIRARILVFPHHGGRPGSANAFEFARRLCDVVRPDEVVFSVGRGRHGTPLPDIVRGVLQAVPAAHIACTQLSDRCAVNLPDGQPEHIGDRPARGRRINACCAGTIEVELCRVGMTSRPARDAHQAFVALNAPTALCAEQPLNT